MANEYIAKDYKGSSQPTTLSNSYTTANTSIVVADGSTFPAGGLGAYFVIVISRGLVDEEKMLISSRTGNTLTIVEKGYDGTTSQNHAASSTVNHCLDAYTLLQANRYVNLQATKGDLVARTTSTTVTMPVGTNTYALVADSALANGIGWQQIAAGGIATDAVTTVKIQDSAVTSAKIATDAVTTVKIQDSAVTSAKIADGTIVNADINASAAIVDTKLATISTASKVSNSATTATSANTASAIVARDASGDFSTGVIVATTNQSAGRGIGIAADPLDQSAKLQFTNNAVSAQWSSLVATNNLLTVTTPIASSSFVGALTGAVTGNVTGNVTGSSGSCTGNSATASNSSLLGGASSSEGNTPSSIARRDSSGILSAAGFVTYGGSQGGSFLASDSSGQFYSNTTFTYLGNNCARVENATNVYDKVVTTRAVYINSTGTLGTLSSSRVYKENIVDYHDATNKLLTLNPVTFDFKEEFFEEGVDEGDDRFNHFGLIAEDVHDAGLTHLVSYNAEGQPKAVDYTMLSVELLGIVKKQQTAIDDLLARVQALETN